MQVTVGTTDAVTLHEVQFEAYGLLSYQGAHETLKKALDSAREHFDLPKAFAIDIYDGGFFKRNPDLSAVLEGASLARAKRLEDAPLDTNLTGNSDTGFQYVLIAWMPHRKGKTPVETGRAAAAALERILEEASPALHGVPCRYAVKPFEVVYSSGFVFSADA